MRFIKCFPMSISDNIRDRQSAESLHKLIGELLSTEIPKLPSDRSREIFFKKLLESAKRNLPNQQSSENALHRLESENDIPSESEDVIEAIEINDEIQLLAICSAWPDAGDVSEKADSIIRTVEKRHYVTVGQLEALRNMLEGLRAWARGED